MSQRLSQAIVACKNELACAVVESLWAKHPDYLTGYTPQGRLKCEQDVRYHLESLAQAIAMDSTSFICRLHKMG